MYKQYRLLAVMITVAIGPDLSWHIATRLQCREVWVSAELRNVCVCVFLQVDLIPIS